MANLEGIPEEKMPVLVPPSEVSVLPARTDLAEMRDIPQEGAFLCRPHIVKATGFIFKII